MQPKSHRDSSKLRLLGSASVLLMAAGAQAAFAEEDSAANDELSLVEESQIQTAQAQQQQQQQAAEEEDLELEEIVVTGSRIARQGFEDIFQPSIVIGSEEFGKVGFQNVADAINDLPSFGAGNDDITTGSGQNVGQQFVDMFDLGTQRTLTVVNGRRFVPGNPLSSNPTGRLEGQQVDLNAFASPLIERVETLSVGGAPIYGADAIAGTVNVVLKDDFEGIDLRYQYENGFGGIGSDNRDNHDVEAVFGANTGDGRGNVTFAIQFEDQRGQVANDFDQLREPAGLLANAPDRDLIVEDEVRFNILEGPEGFLPAPTNGQPLPEFAGAFGPNAANVLTDANGNILTFPGNGDLENTFDIGDPSVGSNPTLGPGGNGFDLSDFEEALVPTQRFTFQSLGHYDLTDNVTAFYEFNFLDTESTDLISQAGTVFNTTFLGSTQGQGNFGVSVNNPFIPDEDQQTLRNALDRQGFTNSDTIFLNGINLGLLPDAGANFVETDQFRVVGGLKGDFQWAERNFNYEISMNWGRTRQTRGEAFLRGDAFFNAVDSVELNEERLDQLKDPDNLAALEETTNSQTINVIRNGEVANISPGDAQVGDIVCGAFLDAPGGVDDDPDNPRGNTGITGSQTPTPDAALSGCTPVNPFVGRGGNPREAIDFISSFAINRGKIQQTDFLAHITGDVVDLPAGTVQATFGAERRRNFGEFLSDGTLEDGLTREPPVPSIPEEEVVFNEFFFETVIPFMDSENDLGINDALGFELISDIEINGSYRLMDNSIKGNNFNVFSAGGTWTMLEGDLTVRGNWTRSARQPSIVELFSPPAQTFDQTGDPCDESNINNTGGAGSQRAQNCLTRAKQLGFEDAQLLDLGGGNVALELVENGGAFNSPTTNAAIALQSSGNADLDFEIANAWSAGFVYSPSFVPGLTFGADFISIEVDNVINEPNFAFFTQDCFDSSNFAAGQFADSCDNFQRQGPLPPASRGQTAGFDIVSGQTQFLNQNTLKMEAIQGNLNYQVAVADAAEFFGLASGRGNWGSLSLRGRFFKRFEFRDSSANLPRQPDGRVANVVGTTGGGIFGPKPELEFTFDVNYTKGPFSFFWRVDYTGDVDACNGRIPGDCDTTNLQGIPLPKDHQHDASIAYDLTEQVSFRGGVNDVLGNDQSTVEQAFGFPGNPFGRTYFLSVDFRM